MDFLLPLFAFLWVTAILTAGAGLQGAIGYGMALVSGPILVLIEPRLMPGPYLVASTLLSILVILRERKELKMGSLGWAIARPGAALAASLLAILAARKINIGFGVVILLGVALSLSGLRFAPSRINLLIAGTLSGIMGTIAAKIDRPATSRADQQVFVAVRRPQVSLTTAGLVNPLHQPKLFQLLQRAVDGYQAQARIFAPAQVIQRQRVERPVAGSDYFHQRPAQPGQPASAGLKPFQPFRRKGRANRVHSHL